MQDIYLDHNHWIYLSRQVWNRSSDVRLQEVVGKIKQLIIGDKIRLPISNVHQLELDKTLNRDQLHRFSETFIAYSQGWVLAPWSEVIREELLSPRDANEKTRRMKGEFTRRGLLSSLVDHESAGKFHNVDPLELESLDRFADTPGAWRFAFKVEAEDAEERVRRMKIQGEQNVKEIENVRPAWKKLSSKEQTDIFAAGVLQDLHETFKAGPDEVVEILDALGTLDPENLYERLALAPSLDVRMALGVAAMRQWSRPTQANDLWDIAFLSVAIPYCDIVVTERFWAHLAGQTGMSEKYSTRVLSNIGELSSILEAFDPE